jgi:hypothetical protein
MSVHQSCMAHCLTSSPQAHLQLAADGARITRDTARVLCDGLRVRLDALQSARLVVQNTAHQLDLRKEESKGGERERVSDQRGAAQQMQEEQHNAPDRWLCWCSRR